MTLEEAISAVAAHPWRKERRAGTEHYTTGQHRFYPIADPSAVSEAGVPLAGIVAYVPTHGHSVAMILLHHDGGEWGDTGAVIYVFGARHGTMELLPSDFELSERMRAVLP